MSACFCCAAVCIYVCDAALRYNAEDFFQPYAAIICMVATYGEGEPCDNSRKLYQWLHDNTASQPPSILKSKAYAVFGLGNRQYEHFNAMGLFFDAAFAALGGERVGVQLALGNSFGLGDDDGTLEDDFSAWRETLWPDLMATLKMEDRASDEPQHFALT
jgi:NADPH-ferrihemoprotein reductase